MLSTSRDRTDMLPYREDISCQKAWEILKSDPRAQLVDVRTQQEWQLVGVPDLSSLQKEPIFLEWMTIPSYTNNPDFKPEVEARFPEKDMPLLFLCKAGGRSMQAASAMAAGGYRMCYNVAGGFEGAGNSSEITTGWQAAQLPWRQK